MFQLTKEEWEMFTKASPLPINEDNNTSSFTDNYNLRSQIVTSRFSDKWGGNRRPPYAFSEIGVAMLSSVLKSEVAIQANRKIMKAFVAYRHLAELPLAATYLDLRKQIEGLRQEVNDILADQNDINESTRNSRWDRYLGMTAAMTQVPVPTATEGLPLAGISPG